MKAVLESDDIIYREQAITEYKNNFLIEALPEIPQSTDKLVKMLTYRPLLMTDEERASGPYTRMQCISRIRDLHIPFQRDIQLYLSISTMIRRGYVERLPNNKNLLARQYESYNALTSGKYIGRYQRPVQQTPDGLTLIGVSGIGKSSAVNTVLSCFPKRINHTKYKGQPCICTQITWMKIECSFDASVKGLCGNFFVELDNILGTNYNERFMRSRYSTDVLMQQMAHKVQEYSVGVLVIDEIQHLVSGRNIGAQKMLNFFVTLINQIGIPIVLIGTNKAFPIIQRELRQIRRGGGQGNFNWTNISNDGYWEMFVRELWHYQFTLEKSQYNKKYSEQLYFLSAGILDVATRIYMLAQKKAILSKKEKISLDTLKSVYNDEMKSYHAPLSAIRSGDVLEMSRFEDIHPLESDSDNSSSFSFQIESESLNGEISEKLKGEKDSVTGKNNKTDKAEVPRLNNDKDSQVSKTNGSLEKNILKELTQEKGADVYQTFFTKGIINTREIEECYQ